MSVTEWTWEDTIPGEALVTNGGTTPLYPGKRACVQGFNGRLYRAYVTSSRNPFGVDDCVKAEQALRKRGGIVKWLGGDKVISCPLVRPVNDVFVLFSCSEDCWEKKVPLDPWGNPVDTRGFK